MSDQCGFSNDGTESTGPHKSNYGDDHMKKKREDVAHGGMVSKLESPAIQANCGIRQDRSARLRTIVPKHDSHVLYLNQMQGDGVNLFCEAQ